MPDAAPAPDGHLICQRGSGFACDGQWCGDRHAPDVDIDRTKVRHAPDERCATNAHCWVHNVDELDQPGDYRVCGECWHIYRQPIELLNAERELIDAINRTLPEEHRLPIYDDPDKIVTCPLCAHDF